MVDFSRRTSTLITPASFLTSSRLNNPIRGDPNEVVPRVPLCIRVFVYHPLRGLGEVRHTRSTEYYCRARRVRDRRATLRSRSNRRRRRGLPSRSPTFAAIARRQPFRAARKSSESPNAGKQHCRIRIRTFHRVLRSSRADSWFLPRGPQQSLRRKNSYRRAI